MNRLRSDLQEALHKMAEAQKDMLAMKQKLHAAELANKQQMAAGKIHSVLENIDLAWCLSRVHTEDSSS